MWGTSYLQKVLNFGYVETVSEKMSVQNDIIKMCSREFCIEFKNDYCSIAYCRIELGAGDVFVF